MIQHNLAAMFTNNRLGVTTKNQAKSSERLASGYKINRAADDAAGLTISEHMRRQIRGLQKASTNSQDAISFCQVADGAIGEIQSIIHRVKELCIQGGNDTNTDADREAIQGEIDALAAEIENITDHTQFNTLQVFGRDMECVGTDSNGEIVSRETVSLEGNNYGLGLILGKDAVSSGSGLDTPVTIASSGWEFTGDLPVNSKAEVEAKIKADTGKSDINYNALTGTGVTKSPSTADPKWARINYNGGYYEITYKQQTTSPFSWLQDSYKYVDANGKVTEYLKDPDTKGTQPSKYESYNAAWLDFSKAGSDYKVEDLYNQGFSVGSAGVSGYYSIMFTDGTDGSSPYKYEADPSKILKLDISAYASMPAPTAGEKIVEKIINAANATGMSSEYMQFGYDKNVNAAKVYMLDNRGADVSGGSFETISRGVDGQQNSSDTITKTTTGANPITYTYEVKDMYIQSSDLGFKGVMMEKAWLTPANIGLNRALVRNYDTASASITICDKALELVSDARSSMGAYMNRFEHSVSINDNSAENVQSSESKLRDADMADEMVQQSKYNILAQAGQAMLAQANQSQEGYLRLLS